jgi:hypothetical protein
VNLCKVLPGHKDTLLLVCTQAEIDLIALSLSVLTPSCLNPNIQRQGHNTESPSCIIQLLHIKRCSNSNKLHRAESTQWEKGAQLCSCEI